jgi:uncharacterized membrane protein YfcA
MRLIKLALAIVAGAIGASLISAVVIVATSIITMPEYSEWSALPLFATMNTILSLAIASTLGLAWHAFATRRNWTGLAFYLAPAAIVGVLGGLMASSGTSQLWMGAYGALLGALTALFAWLIRRPDRDTPNPDRAAP